MKPLIVYTYARCSTCRDAVKWLSDHGIAHTEKPIRETPPSIAELKAMLAQQDGKLGKLFNSSGMDYRAMGLSAKLPAMSLEESLALLHSNGNLVKRPFVLGDGIGLVGFKASEWEKRLG